MEDLDERRQSTELLQEIVRHLRIARDLLGVRGNQEEADRGHLYVSFSNL